MGTRVPKSEEVAGIRGELQNWEMARRVSQEFIASWSSERWERFQEFDSSLACVRIVEPPPELPEQIAEQLQGTVVPLFGQTRVGPGRRVDCFASSQVVANVLRADGKPEAAEWFENNSANYPHFEQAELL